MVEIFKVFSQVIEQYGVTAAILLAVLIVLVFILWRVIKNSLWSITKFLEDKVKESGTTHKKALAYRKNITPQVRNELSDLAKKLNVDRTVLLEYSNGSQNLVGLPFLFLNATSEFIKPGVSSVSYKYQRMNTSILAPVIEDMESYGYLLVENIEEIIDKYPMLYGMMKSDKVTSVLLYPLYGMDNSIGFIEIMDSKMINKKEAVPILSNAAQRISSLLNYDEINDEGRQRK